MRSLTINMLILLLFFLPATCLASRYYIWTDAKGTKHISEEPPPGSVKKADSVNFKNPAPVTRAATPGRGGGRETRVEIIGNQVLVPVILKHEAKKIKATLLLDTGASMTVLFEETARKLTPDRGKKNKMRVAGGELIDAGLLTLSSITVGAIRKKEIQASVIKHQGPAVDFDGLLGMDFLKGQKYHVDFEKQLIIWHP